MSGTHDTVTNLDNYMGMSTYLYTVRDRRYTEKKRGAKNASSWGAVCLFITQLLLGSRFFLNAIIKEKWLHLPKRRQFSKRLLKGAVLAPLFSSV